MLETVLDASCMRDVCIWTEESAAGLRDYAMPVFNVN